MFKINFTSQSIKIVFKFIVSLHSHNPIRPIDINLNKNNATKLINVSFPNVPIFLK